MKNSHDEEKKPYMNNKHRGQWNNQRGKYRNTGNWGYYPKQKELREESARSSSEEEQDFYGYEYDVSDGQENQSEIEPPPKQKSFMERKTPQEEKEERKSPCECHKQKEDRPKPYRRDPP